jgi:hypothetical protein
MDRGPFTRVSVSSRTARCSGFYAVIDSILVRSRFVAWLCWACVIAPAAGCSSTVSGGGETCTAGLRRECIGNPSCHGTQICNTDGNGYGACECGAGGAAGTAGSGASGGSGGTGTASGGAGGSGQGGRVAQAGQAGQSGCTPIDDGKECTDDVCVGGVLKHTPKAERTPCATGYCTVAGDCRTCVFDSDCGASTGCTGNACLNNACTTGPLKRGTLCNANVDQCDGFGNCVDCTDNGGCDECCVCSAQVCVPA